MTQSEIIYAIDVLTRTVQLCYNSPNPHSAAEEKLKELISKLDAGTENELSLSDLLVGVQKNTHAESDLISFGNYLLSAERAERTSPENQNAVTDADFDWWKNGNNNK